MYSNQCNFKKEYEANQQELYLNPQATYIMAPSLYCMKQNLFICKTLFGNPVFDALIGPHA